MQPVILEKLFNDSKGVTIADSGKLSENKIHAKFFRTMKVQVTGPRSVAESLGVAEYVRWLVQVMVDYDIVIDQLKLHNINYGVKMNMRGKSLDRKIVYDKLNELMSDCNEMGKAVHVNHVTFDEAQYAGIKLKLHVEVNGHSKKSPTLLIFQSGYVMIMACSFDVLAKVVEYMDQVGMLREPTHGSTSDQSRCLPARQRWNVHSCRRRQHPRAEDVGRGPHPEDHQPRL